jgi:hypothetical protein
MSVYPSVGDWVTSSFGLVLTIGGVLATTSAFVGAIGVGQGVERLIDVGNEVAAPGGPPTADQRAKLDSLGARVERFGKIDLVLLLLAVTAMATARYWQLTPRAARHPGHLTSRYGTLGRPHAQGSDGANLVLTWCHEWCHTGAMELDPYVQGIRRQLEVAAEAGGEEARAVADRLYAPLEAAIRLAVQDALAAATEEITLELAPGSVELRLRGREPEFVVTPPPADPLAKAKDVDDVPPGEWLARRTGSREATDEDDSVARINLRLPQWLKAKVEQAAADEGLSVNSWLVRSTASAVEWTDGGRQLERRTARGPQRYQGWSR